MASMPSEWFRAVRWTAREIEEGGRNMACGRCRGVARTHLCCTSCEMAYCRPCLELDPGSMWAIGFECAACMLDLICHLDPVGEHEVVLMALANELNKTKSHTMAKGTWDGYQRCMKQVLQFMRETRIWVFPVMEHAHALGLCLFFQSLKVKGISWATMARYRSALVSVGKCIGMTSPWERFPQLELCLPAWRGSFGDLRGGRRCLRC